MVGPYIEFCALANIDKEVSPWKGVRRTGKIYGMFSITSQVGQWHDRFVGLEFMAEILFTKNERGARKIDRVIPVRLAGRYAIRGRPISGEAVTMI